MTKAMVTLDTVQASTSRSTTINEPTSSPRISFSAEFLDEINTTNSFITICPTSPAPDFEFLSSSNSLAGAGAGPGADSMTTADELFFEGKLLPFWQARHADKLAKISLETNPQKEQQQQQEEAMIVKEISSAENQNSNGNRVINTSGNAGSSWFVDDDPSPRPPKCTVLWKELLRLKKQRAASALSPSASSSSSSSSASSLGDAAEGSRHVKQHNHGHNHKGSARKGLERTRSATIRIRPMINVPICTQVKSGVVATGHHHHALPPLFPLKKGKLER